MSLNPLSLLTRLARPSLSGRRNPARAALAMAGLLALLLLPGCVLATPPPPEPTEPPESAAPAQQQPSATATRAPAPTATAPPPGAAAAQPRPTSTVAPTATLAPASGAVQRQFSAPPPMSIDVGAEYEAVFSTNRGNFRVELLPAQAPVTVNNFVFLARQGFYDGLIFHRVIPGFMIQGGDPTGTGAGNPGYRFNDEIAPGLTFDAPGKLAMANAGRLNDGSGTNGSQFFITVEPTPWLQGRHTIFGTVTSGQEVVDAISEVTTDGSNRPLSNVVIERIEIVANTGS